MRVHSIKGQGVGAIRKDSTSQVNRWVLYHEFRTTYRDSLIGSEKYQNYLALKKKESEAEKEAEKDAEKEDDK
jgi:putative ABC transport system permease protein